MINSTSLVHLSVSTLTKLCANILLLDARTRYIVLHLVAYLDRNIL